MKYIQRYANFSKTLTIPAGVYVLGSVIDSTVNFNLWVNYIRVGLTPFDSVTSEALSGLVVLKLYPNTSFQLYRDNPGLTSTSESVYAGTASEKQSAELQAFLSMSAGEILRYSAAVNLGGVTANPVTAIINWTIGYLCPEDYLSIEGILISPK